MLAALIGAGCFGATSGARAEVTPQRSWTTLVSSNGHGAVVMDLVPGNKAQVHHFREHLFATEEPLIDTNGNDIFISGKPQSIYARDLLYDMYFGLRAGSSQRWLKGLPVDLDASGYEGTVPGATGSTGVLRMVQRWNALEITQYVFAPTGLEHAGFAMIAKVRNTGSAPIDNVALFSLHNFHMGFGRPGPQLETGEENETVAYDGTSGAFAERGFAGVMVTKALGSTAHRGASSASSPTNVWSIVENGGTGDLPDVTGEQPMGTGSISAFQAPSTTLAANGETWFGVVSAHHGDPFAAQTVKGWLDAWVAGRDPQKIVQDERTRWATFQSSVVLPAGLTPEEEALYRHSAVVLRMAQVREDSTFLRPVLGNDGEVRRSRFGDLGQGKTVSHGGKGAVLASLPPGEWTYAWPRDGSYAVAAMAMAGMKTEAKAALEFWLTAEGGRFQAYNELSGYGMPPYRISMCRYHGFGVEETDFNDFGPNLEFDGFGLALWALGAYTEATGDTSVRHERFQEITTRIADPIVALVDPATGLLRADSSIWETHWNGRQRQWTYTNITAARGLCDAAVMAQAEGDSAASSKYLAAGTSLRNAIAAKLIDSSGALASNAEELAAGDGYADAAVLDAIAFGLFDPNGKIAKATVALMDAKLKVKAGVGWARNDDAWDHTGATDVSPWGSYYDSAEWVITDMRGAIVRRMGGDSAGSDKLIDWVRRQAAVNYLQIAETYDENQGTYKFNAPMVGFGAGAYMLALAHAKGFLDIAPACGAYFEENPPADAGPDAPVDAIADSSPDVAGDTTAPADGGPDGSSGGGGSAGAPDAGPLPDAGPVATGDAGDDGCGCSVPGGASRTPLLALAALLGVSLLRRLGRRAGQVDHRGARDPSAPAGRS